MEPSACETNQQGVLLQPIANIRAAKRLSLSFWRLLLPSNPVDVIACVKNDEDGQKRQPAP